MGRLKILIWHSHGSYLNALARLDHDWYLPVKPDYPEGYAGRGFNFNLPDSVHETPAEYVCDLDLDLIIYQTPKNHYHDSQEILTAEQRRLPSIYLEHNPPGQDAVSTPHPLDDPNMLLVHVTNYNRLMWDNQGVPTTVIEPAAVIDPAIRYRGDKAEGIAVVDRMLAQPRVSGYDVLMDVQGRVPVTAAGVQSDEFGGLGPIPDWDLQRVISDYRFLFSPLRYASLPQAVIEAMTIGMPVVALAATELPAVIENGHSGYVSNDPAELISHMRRLIAEPEEARRLGANAREVALQRFGIERFADDWNRAFNRVLAGTQRADYRPARIRQWTRIAS